MPLKRGLERGSCDFCFRRKIKCDRSSQIETGRVVCSQCDLRQIPCTFESDDIRIHRRRKIFPKGGVSDIGFGASKSIRIRPQQQACCHNIGDDSCSRALNQSFALGNDAPTFSSSTAVSNPLDSVAIDITTNTQSPMILSPSTCSGFQFQLSPEGVEFLDSIFLQNINMTEPIPNHGNLTSSPLPFNNDLDNPVPTNNPNHVPDIRHKTLDAAIDAYFKFAALALPVLCRDGFMADYTSQHSSPALVFAVACRGCPFIETTEKWVLQQRFASCFRDSFLQARSTLQGQNTVRLDDLEALALMVDFQYEKSEDLASPLQLQLQNLLLTQDSLVSMVRQYRIETCPTRVTGLPTVLSEARQRQILLFWHVYGWDAFISLDRKMPSQIRDEDMDASGPIREYEGQRYFDAILGLAFIARRMARTLCGPVARRKGIKHQDIEILYKQLEEWHTNICPSTLHIHAPGPASSRERTVSLSTEIEFPLLYQAVVTLLEMNCYMQLEACVSQYGIEEPDSFAGQIIETRVKYETLRAAHKIMEVAEKLAVSQPVFSTTATHTLVDLAPGVIRNICAGASTWISRKARENLYRETPRLGIAVSNRALGDEGTQRLPRDQARSLMESAVMLRNVAAAATSHKDTEAVIERLNKQLGSLERLAMEAT